MSTSPTPNSQSRNVGRVTAAEVAEVRRSMALQTLTLPSEPILSRESAKNTMFIAGAAHGLDDAEELLQGLMALGFVRETLSGGIEITNMGYLELHNRYRYPLFEQSFMGSQMRELNRRLATYEATNTTFMNELLRLANRANSIETDLSKVKVDYMRKDYWTSYIYPVLAATIPALIVGAVFYFITVFAPHH